MVYKNIYMIVATTEKTNSIGANNDMVYNIEEDMAFFKKTTLNQIIVVGFKTYNTFHVKPLPKRRNIVLTRKNIKIDGVEIKHDVSEILSIAENNPNEKIFICGGDSIYHQFMPYASKLYVTFIEEKNTVKADSFFPKIDDNIWKKIWEKPGSKILENNINYKFTIWERK